MKKERFQLLSKCVTCILVLLSVVVLWGQQTRGVVLGRVTDPSGATVPEAKVILANEKTGIVTSAATSTQGEYTFTNVEPGSYRVTVSSKGFETSVVREVVVFVAQTVRVDVALKVGDLSSRVEVQATIPVVQSETSSVGNVVDGSQVSTMPLNGRGNMLGLMSLAPGVQRGNVNPLIAGGDWYGGANFTVDGVNNNDNANERGLSNFPSLESVAEFKVMGSGAPAEFGRGGAQVMLVTKSGTNDLHGSVLWFNRIRATSAQNFFSTGQPKAQFIRNEYGASLGGPIVKNKTFYFGSFEGLRSITARTNTFALPTAALKSGDFSNLTAIKDPWASGTPFANNQIPTSRISSVAAQLMKFYPNPNKAGTGTAGLGNNFTLNFPTVESNDRYSMRVDHNIDDQNKVTLRFFEARNGPYQNSVSGSTGTYGGWSGYGSAARSLLAGWTRILSPAAIHEVRFGYQRNLPYRKGQNLDFDPSKLINGDLAPLPGLGGLPTVSITGFKGLSDYGGSSEEDVSVELFDTVTVTRGRHTLKAGVEFQRVMYRIAGTSFSTYSFDSRYSGQAFADFLLGAMSASTRPNKHSDRRPRNNRYNAFIQDDWAVTPKLTLNLGLRYEYAGLFTNANRDLSNFDPVTGKLVVLDGTPDSRWTAVLPAVNGSDIGVSAGNHISRDFTNFAPRFGFAFRPLGKTSLVLRGSYGIFYNAVTMNVWGTSVMQNPPFILTESFEPTTSSVPALTWTNPFPGAGNIPSSPTVIALAKDFKTPYAHQWNLTMEHEVMKGTAVRASYVGNVGIHLHVAMPINDPASMAAGQVQPRRPYQPFGSITMYTSDRNSATHQLQLGTTRRVRHGLSFGAEYMWTRALGPNVTGTAPMVFSNMRLDRGNLDSVIRHSLAINYIYDLPFGAGRKFMSSARGLTQKAVGGWQIAGISRISSGTPFSVTFNSSTLGWTSNRADVVPGAALYPTEKSITQWFNTSAFKVPASFTYGNSARNMLFGPGSIDWDVSVFKNASLTERLNLQFRAEFFNILNHTNFGSPASNFSVSTTFGRISSAGSARNIQFGLRLEF